MAFPFRLFACLFAMVFCSLTLLGQGNAITVTGRVFENGGRAPIEFATVLIADSETEQAITGATTDIEGIFEVQTQATDFFVEVSFIGYVSQVFTNDNMVGGVLDLGDILLSSNSQTLDEVVVRADKSQTEFRLDKRVFNVGQDLSTTGASALEVLNNVPSVNVSIEGQISLRGSSGVQILVDGKPTVLASEQGNALGTITADMIESIEVITNPSAKYDAEGTSGIINIVMKKESKEGLNGSATLNVGTPNNHSVGLSLNRRTPKFNLFSQIGAGYRTFPEEFKTGNEDLTRNTTIYGTGDHEKNETFYNLILGTDYHIDDYNVLSLSGHFAFEKETEYSDTDFRYIDSSGTTLSTWTRDEDTKATNPKWEYDLEYKREFKDDEDHTLQFSALGNFFGKDQSSVFTQNVLTGDEELHDQQTHTKFQEAEYTFKFDYTKPFSEKVTMETGAQYVINDVSNDYSVDEKINDDWVEVEDLTNVFEYKQDVLAVYATGAYEADKWGVMLGLRAENTNLKTLLTNTDEENTQNYLNLFPSVHTSYKLNDLVSFQAGYSRRIMRPRLWDLNPFTNIRNNFAISTGNPNLQPEFTDSYEITSIYIFGELSMNLGVYHRYTTDVVERISYFEDNISVSRPENIGTNRATGVEFNAKYSPAKWLTLNGNFNYNYFKRQGELETTIIDYDADLWTSQLNAKLKLPLQIDFEITGNYDSKYRTIQTEVSDNLYADLGVRKKILRGKAVVNLSVRDIFASRVFESETIQPTFLLYSRRQRGRFVTLGFSYGFGKGEAMEFSGQKMF